MEEELKRRIMVGDCGCTNADVLSPLRVSLCLLLGCVRVCECFGYFFGMKEKKRGGMLMLSPSSSSSHTKFSLRV